MYGKPLGLPNKTPQPERRDCRRNSGTDKATWMHVYSGVGTGSTFTVPVDSWTSVPGSPTKEAYLMVDFGEPTNLTHISLSCDNSLLDNYYFSSVTAWLYCHYSHDGISWTDTGFVALLVSYYYKSGSADNLPAYVWIPRTKIKARYWRIVIPLDYFKSSYGDELWHISIAQFGTLDHIHDITYDGSITGANLTVADVENTVPATHQNSVNIGRYFTTDIDLSVVLYFKMDDGVRGFTEAAWYDAYSKGWLISPQFDRKRTVYNFCTLMTRTGFAIGIGHLSNSGVDSPNQDYAGVGLYRSGYKALGFTNNPALGVATKMKYTVSGGVASIQNPLGYAPDVILFISYGRIAFITHPSDPSTAICTRDSVNSVTATITPATIKIPQVEVSIGAVYTSAIDGIICIKERAGVMATGVYAGDGVSPKVISTPGITPTMVIVVRLDDSTSYKALLTSGSTAIDVTYSRYTYDSAFLVQDTGFEVTSTIPELNEVGGSYVWWAFQ